MDWQDYHCDITANISLKAAFESISKRVPEWWTPNFEGRSEKANDIFTVRFGNTFVDFKITEVIPDNTIVWKVTDCYLHWLQDKTEWTDTKIVWEFSTDNGAAMISMTHLGLAPDVECYDSCSKGWDFFVKHSLVKLLTEGKGLPDTTNRSLISSHR